MVWQIFFHFQNMRFRVLTLKCCSCQIAVIIGDLTKHSLCILHSDDVDFRSKSFARSGKFSNGTICQSAWWKFKHLQKPTEACGLTECLAWKFYDKLEELWKFQSLYCSWTFYAFEIRPKHRWSKYDFAMNWNAPLFSENLKSHTRWLFDYLAMTCAQSSCFHWPPHHSMQLDEQ